MKRLILILFLFASFLFSNAQNYEIENVKRDTINRTDANAKKQGVWVLMGYAKKGSCYQPQQKIEEGRYKDNRKIGTWIEYYCNSNVKSRITFEDGKPHGKTSLYYENGSLKEEGTWINNRWVGNYKLIDENGIVTEKKFDDNGKEISTKIAPSKNSVSSKKK